MVARDHSKDRKAEIVRLIEEARGPRDSAPAPAFSPERHRNIVVHGDVTIYEQGRAPGPPAETAWRAALASAICALLNECDLEAARLYQFAELVFARRVSSLTQLDDAQLLTLHNLLFALRKP